MIPKQLVLLVEGEGDRHAAPVLVRRLLREYEATDVLVADSQEPLKVGEFSKLCKNDFSEWRRFLKLAIKRKNVGACLLLLDGDSPCKVDGQPFCAARAGRRLAAAACEVGAGKVFSLATVFACMEFESWLIAGAASLAGRTFHDGRRELPDRFVGVPPNPEVAPRDAKSWFRRQLKTGYKPTRDQAELTALVDLAVVRQNQMRSFRRLESALQGLVGSVRKSIPTVTPALTS